MPCFPVLLHLTIGEGTGTPLQHSFLENPMDGGAWWAAVHGVTKSRTRLSDFTFTFHFHALEKEMETHSSVLAWRIPGTGEPGGLPSMGSHRVGHDWSDLAAAATIIFLALLDSPGFQDCILSLSQSRSGVYVCQPLNPAERRCGPCLRQVQLLMNSYSEVSI